MLPDRVSNPGPLTYESGALPIALRGPAENLSERTTKIIGEISQQNSLKRSGINFSNFVFSELIYVAKYGCVRNL